MLAAKRKLRWINICFTAECLVLLLWRTKKIKKAYLSNLYEELYVKDICRAQQIGTGKIF